MPKLLRASALLPELGPEEFAHATGVSRETLARLKAYIGVLRDWNARHNLVSRTSMEDVWQRHVWDSAQLASLVAEEAYSLVDLGSGAGFPGLVLAILLRERSGFRTVLYESVAKKAEFLKTAAAAAQVSVNIRNTRIENASPEVCDVVTARACAPLPRLLAYAQPFQGPNTTNLFLKGQNAGVELTEAAKSWKMKVVRHPSQTDSTGVILEIHELARVR